MTKSNHVYDELPVEMIDVGHARLAYRRVGTGPDLVFVHGWPLTGSTFRDVINVLADSYTCHVFDLPGTGDSECPNLGDINMAKHADAITKAVDEIELERYGLVGHDSGALIARVVAAGHQERVKGLVLGNTEIPGHRPWMLRMYVALGRLPLARALMPLALRSRLYRHTVLGFGGCFRSGDYIDGEFHDRVVEPLFNSKRTAVGQMGLLLNFDWSDFERLPETHAKLTAPVQLVWGEDDPWFPLAKARTMLLDFPEGSELKIIEGGKLFAHEEFADQFATHARRFFDRMMPRVRLSASA